MYYLRSRYYCPELHRFIGADAIFGSPGDILSQNIFAYCKNSSVREVDVDGTASVLAIALNRIINKVKVILYTISKYLPVSPKPPKHKKRAETVTVKGLMLNLGKMEKKKTDVSSKDDTGCGMFIRAAVTGTLRRHGHHVYHAGMTQMFDSDMIFSGNIEDIGGADGLIEGMILGTAKGKKVGHGGVYAGLHDFGNGLEHAVYSFNTAEKQGNLRPYTDINWTYYGWHKGIILP